MPFQGQLFPCLIPAVELVVESDKTERNNKKYGGVNSLNVQPYLQTRYKQSCNKCFSKRILLQIGLGSGVGSQLMSNLIVNGIGFLFVLVCEDDLDPIINWCQT